MRRFLPPCLVLLFLAGALALPAQVVINEYSAANWQQFVDNHNDYEDWIELYNNSVTAVDLSAYGLSDDPDAPLKWQFPVGTTIPADGYVRVWCSGRDRNDAGGHYHTNYRLTQTRANPEILVLAKPDGTIVDQVQVQRTVTHQSRCRTGDAAPTWAICTTPTPKASNSGSTQYLALAARPTMDVLPGFYSSNLTVTVATTEPNAVIRYTLDGTDPTQTSPVYTAPLQITETTVVKARAYSPNTQILPSLVRFNTYFINEPNYTLPVFSIAAKDLQNLANGNGNLKPIGSIEYFGIDKDRKAASYGELNRHGQDSWVNPQRSMDWISRDEFGYSRAVEEPLYSYSDRDEFQRVMFRAVGDDNYPSSGSPAQEGSCHMRDDYVQTLSLLGNLALDERSSERCIVFLNGAYWGVYSIREKTVDHDYTEYYYNQGKYDIQYLETWGSTWADYGGHQAHADWSRLRRFMMTNDMGAPGNFEYMADSINFLSMIDYFTVNLNVVASDWLNYNTGWWRGRNPDGEHKKWGYILWDLDATFDYYINYTGVPNTTPFALPCDINAIADNLDNWFSIDEDTCQILQPVPQQCQYTNGKHEQLFVKLRDESPQFRQLYFQRYADLMNTTFSCENMLYVFDSMVAVIAPEMPKHIERWGGTMQEWETNLGTMRNFITQRCAFIPQGLVDCYEVEGPYPVTLLVEPAGAGRIEFNTLKHDSLPWTGSYYGNMFNNIDADAYAGYTFSHWEVKSPQTSNILPDTLTENAELLVAAPDTLIAHFTPSTATKNPDNILAIKVFPTIASDRLHVTYTLPDALPVEFALYAATGRRVLDWSNGVLPAGEHTTTLELSAAKLPAGLYWLETRAGNQRRTVKVVVGL